MRRYLKGGAGLLLSVSFVGLQALNDYIQRRALHRADVYARRIHPEVELPKDVPGRIREAQVYLKLSADSQCTRRSKERGLGLSVCQRRASSECD